MKNDLKLLTICGVILILTACTPIKNSQYEKYSSLVAEPAECLNHYTYDSTTTISGNAKFYKRGVNLVMESVNLKNLTLGDPLVDALPIRYSEVAVYNSKNELVQCGLTNSLGQLKGFDGISDLQIPAQSDLYTIRVMARMNIALSAPAASPTKPEFNAHISIKHDLYTNELHFISLTVPSNGSDNINNADIYAYARQTDSLGIEGGAFNILNSIYTAFDYIRNHTGAVDTTCLNEKLNVYWAPGFNPYQYLHSNEDPSTIENGSFYLAEEQNLFITGGRLGNLSIDVTNHFDDYVILHEFAHHIENRCGRLLSPGGSHTVLSRIDPRFSWAEGWANFFAAEVMYDSDSIANINPEISTKLTNAGLPSRWTYLFSSKGFSDSVQNVGNGTGFMFDLKRAGNNPDTWQYGPYEGRAFDRVDPPRYPGEGHFREGAITRGLFKLANNCGGTCTTSTPVTFESFWKAMDKITGIGQTIYSFKSSHDFLEKVKSLVDATPGTWAANYINFNQAQTSEALHLFSDGIYTATGINRWIPYGTYLTTLTAGACPIGQTYIEPRTDDPVLTSVNSDQRYSNHFYTIDFGILNSLTELNVTFTKQNVSGTNTEFDILLFQENYTFNGDYNCTATDSSGNCNVATRVTTSDVVRSDRRSGSIATKTIKNLSSLDPTKRYLLDIRAYTPNKSINSLTDYSYVITNQAGLKICP